MKYKSIYTSIWLLICFSTVSINAQDLEPRALSAIPTGGNFLIASYGYSTGNILVDNALPIENLNANLNNIVVAYARSFNFFGRLAQFDAILPYSIANFSGIVSTIDSTTYRNGFADPLFRLSVILIGSRPYSLADFSKHVPKKFNLGLALRVRPPFGQYLPEKAINLGANRWALKIALASSYTFSKKFIVEAHLINWFFTENSNFFNGNTLSQQPIIVGQLHFSYIMNPKIWVAMSLGKSFLGKTELNGVERDDEQNNSRFGFVFAYRVKKQHAIKVAFTSGVSTRYGADFNTFILAYQFMWFDKPK